MSRLVGHCFTAYSQVSDLEEQTPNAESGKYSQELGPDGWWQDKCKATEREREVQRKMGMAIRNPVEIFFICRIPIHIAVTSGLHLNYQLAFPKRSFQPGGNCYERSLAAAMLMITVNALGAGNVTVTSKCYSSRWNGQEISSNKGRDEKGQTCPCAESEKIGRTRRMLKPDLGKWSIASGNSRLQGRLSGNKNGKLTKPEEVERHQKNKQGHSH